MVASSRQLHGLNGSTFAVVGANQKVNSGWKQGNMRASSEAYELSTSEQFKALRPDGCLVRCCLPGTLPYFARSCPDHV